MKTELKILSPLQSPMLQLDNRVVMAPMSRRRSLLGIPSSAVPVYYGQRAGAGLIIAENSAVAINGIGYLGAPGIYNDAQKEMWRKVVEAVHLVGGKISLQLVHSGRVGHHLNHENEAPLVAPSAVQAPGNILVPSGEHLDMPIPLALSTQEAEELIAAHIRAAVTAIEIGFDAVEIHGAHGFLPEQFLNPHINHRTDRFGGSIENRSRFLLEIVEGTIAAIGAEKTGIRLSPFAGVNGLPPYEEELETHRYIVERLEQLGILYLHLSSLPVNGIPSISEDYLKETRSHFSKLIIVAGDYTLEKGEAVLEKGLADLIAFGRPFISNPDLVERFRNGKELTPSDPSTYYHGGERGYIDYPTA